MIGSVVTSAVYCGVRASISHFKLCDLVFAKPELFKACQSMQVFDLLP